MHVCIYIYSFIYIYIYIYVYIYAYKPDKFPLNSSLMKHHALMQNSSPILLCDILKYIMNACSPVMGASYAWLAKQKHGHATASRLNEVERQRSHAPTFKKYFIQVSA